MNLDRLNKWMTLTANVGVLTGIFFLAFELRQNTAASRMEAATIFQDSFSEIEFFIAQSPEFADLLEAGRNGDAINGADKLRLTVFYGNVLRTWQNAHLQYLSGALHEDIWRGSRARLSVVLQQDRGLIDHWRANQSQFSPAFNKLIASLSTEPIDDSKG